jgi:hypothetical protein
MRRPEPNKLFMQGPTEPLAAHSGDTYEHWRIPV